MRFLIDESLSPKLRAFLNAAGDTCQHIRDVTGTGVSDEAIVEVATATHAVVITADTDFGTLLARSGKAAPSVILVRALLALPITEQGQLIAQNMSQLRDALATGAIVVITQEDIRVRPLPVTRRPRRR